MRLIVVAAKAGRLLILIDKATIQRHIGVLVLEVDAAVGEQPWQSFDVDPRPEHGAFPEALGPTYLEATIVLGSGQVQPSHHTDEPLPRVGPVQLAVLDVAHLGQPAVHARHAVPHQPVHVVSHGVAGVLLADVLHDAEDLVLAGPPVPLVDQFHVRQHSNPVRVSQLPAAVHLPLGEGVVPEAEVLVVSEHAQQVGDGLQDGAGHTLLVGASHEVSPTQPSRGCVRVPVRRVGRAAVVAHPPIRFAGKET